jgi:hypothetical protein
MEDNVVLTHLANTNGNQPLYHPTGRLKKVAGVTRAQVIEAFHNSFELIGGVPRLAIWADANPSDFFKLYGRLLPASSTTELDGPQEIVVRHSLPPPGNIAHAGSGVNGDQDNLARLQTQEDISSISRETTEMGD